MARPKGARSKTTCVNRADIVRQLEKIGLEWINDPDVEKRREGFKAVTPYFLPKLTATTLSGDKDKDPLTVIVKLNA